MAKIYTAEDFAKKTNVDMEKIEADKKKKAAVAKKKREDEAKKKPGYQAPSGSTEKAAD